MTDPIAPAAHGDMTALAIERLAIANEARRYAAFYAPASDGRNTFIILAEWIEARDDAARLFPSPNALEQEVSR